jgi:hypothetical protein
LLAPWAALNVLDQAEGIRARCPATSASSRRRRSAGRRRGRTRGGGRDERAHGARPWLAHNQSEYARLLLARDEPGDRGRALELAGRALEGYRSLGMDSFAAEAARLERKLGAAHAR